MEQENSTTWATPSWLTTEEARVRNSALGSFLGAACGDALGSQVEFHDPRFIRQALPRGFDTMVGSPVWNTEPGQPTDDTEMALSLAHALTDPSLDSGTFDRDVIASWYSLWLRSHPFDVGGTCGAAIRGAQMHSHRTGESLADLMAKSANPGSKANGALMRNVPLALFAARVGRHDEDLEDCRRIARYARSEAKLTHPNPACVDANIVYMIFLVAMVRDGLTPRQAFARVMEYREYLASDDIVSTLTDMQDVLDSDWDTSIRVPRPEQGGRVDIALRRALYAVLAAEQDVKDGVAHISDVYGSWISWVCLQGGDTDTNCAIAGGLVGAFVGIDNIPQRWVVTVLACNPSNPEFQPRPSWLWCSQIPTLVNGLLGLPTDPQGQRQPVSRTAEDALPLVEALLP